MSTPSPAQSPGGRYIVYVDDNFHYMDEEERYKLGEFDTPEAAIQACRRIVDDFLLANYRPGQTAEKLNELYRTFGEDPWCPLVTSSAWGYAE